MRAADRRESIWGLPQQREYGSQAWSWNHNPELTFQTRSRRQRGNPFETSKLTPSDIFPLSKKVTPNPPQLVAVQVFCVFKYSNVQEIFKPLQPSSIHPFVDELFLRVSELRYKV